MSTADDPALSSKVLGLELARRRTLLVIPAALWVGAMLTRPHKEERFLYPVYPFIAVAAATALVTLCSMITSLNCMLFKIPTGMAHAKLDLKAAGDMGMGHRGEAVHSAVVPDSGPDGNSNANANFLFKAFMGCAVLVSAGISSSRIVSSFVNYRGYRDLWMGLHVHTTRAGAAAGTTVCVDGQWDKFPSHFFLPDAVRLAFVQDSFHGQLPQPFAPFVPLGDKMIATTGMLSEILRASKGAASALGCSSFPGTASVPLQPFNDLNREEPSRYMELGECDFLVSSLPDVPKKGVMASKDGLKLKSMGLDHPKAKAVMAKLVIEDYLSMSRASLRRSGSLVTRIGYEDFDGVVFEDVFPLPLWRTITDAAKSPALMRAYYVPYVSRLMNKYKRYFVLQRQRSQLDVEVMVPLAVDADADADADEDAAHYPAAANAANAAAATTTTTTNTNTNTNTTTAAAAAAAAGSKMLETDVDLDGGPQ
jgi:alpha-1,2-mannosyltransferase